MSGEIVNVAWREVRFHPTYSVSTDGQVRNNKTGRILKQFLGGTKRAYLCVNLDCDVKAEVCLGRKWAPHVDLDGVCDGYKSNQITAEDDKEVLGAVLTMTDISRHEVSRHEAIEIIKAYRDRLACSVSNQLDMDIQAFDTAIACMEYFEVPVKPMKPISMKEKIEKGSLQ